MIQALIQPKKFEDSCVLGGLRSGWAIIRPRKLPLSKRWLVIHKASKLRTAWPKRDGGSVWRRPNAAAMLLNIAIAILMSKQVCTAFNVGDRFVRAARFRRL